jgi:hypothetical protein
MDRGRKVALFRVAWAIHHLPYWHCIVMLGKWLWKDKFTCAVVQRGPTLLDLVSLAIGSLI